jgi:hypothetical protein
MRMVVDIKYAMIFVALIFVIFIIEDATVFENIPRGSMRVD